MARVMKKTHVKNAKKKQKFKQKVLQNKEPTVVRECRKINSWQEDRMLGAIEEFRRGSIGLRVIARAWGVPKSTLERRVKGKVVGHEHLLGKKTLLSHKQESELEELLLEMARRGFPMKEHDVRDLAYQYAARNGIAGFSAEKQLGGYYWMKRFLKRHPAVSVKRPEGLSAARACGMNKPVILKWFSDFATLLSKLNIKEMPSHIWNLDESGFQDHFVPKKAAGEKGKPLYQVTSSERGETVTVLPVFNAMGEFGPLMIIFKGMRVQKEWLVGSPQNAVVRASKDGYINKEIFLEFGQTFTNFLKTKSDPRKHIYY